MLDFDLQAYAEQNPDLVVRRESTRYPGLFVVKYHRRVFYKGLWTPELAELRGLVVDAHWNVVARPFTKVFNRGENGTDFDRSEIVQAVVKVNGFMAAATLTQDHGLLISTTGSLDSDFVDLASKHIGDLDFEPGYTYLFEICDPADPHIIPEVHGAYLIGMRDLEVVPDQMIGEHQLDAVAQRLGVMRPDHFTTRFGALLDSMPDVRHEGFMVYSGTGALKLKSPYYLTNKLLARIRDTKLDKWVDSGYIREVVDEEYYPLIDHVAAHRAEFIALDEQARLDFMKEFLNNG